MLLTGTLFPLFPVPSALASRAASVSPLGTISCCSLRSTCFHRLPHYYEAVRLLTDRQVLSIYKTSIALTEKKNFSRSLPDLPGMQILPLHARHALLTPVEPVQSRLTTAHCCLRPRGRYRLPLYMTYGAESLHAFALRLSCSSAYA